MQTRYEKHSGIRLTRGRKNSSIRKKLPNLEEPSLKKNRSLVSEANDQSKVEGMCQSGKKGGLIFRVRQVNRLFKAGRPTTQT